MNGDSDLEEPLYLKENGMLTGRVWVDIETSLGAALPSTVTFGAEEKDDDGNEVGSWWTSVPYETDGKYEFSFEIDTGTIPAGHELVMRINIQQDTGKTKLTFHMRGESYCILPLEDDTDGDGTVDSQDNDDDEDDLPDIWEDANGLDSRMPTKMMTAMG